MSAVIWTTSAAEYLQDVADYFFQESPEAAQKFVDNIETAAGKLSTDRLKKLTDTGIVVRSKATIDQESVTYGLTSVGLHVTPVLDAIKKFAEVVRSAEDSPEKTLQ